MATTVQESGSVHFDPRVISEQETPPAAATLGVWLYLAGMTVAFAWLFIAFTYVRLRVPLGPHEHLVLPAWFWFSTFIVLVSSLTMQWAHAACRAGRIELCRNALVGTAGLGSVFLGLQVTGFTLLFQGASEASRPFLPIYYIIGVMAALHGVHLVGGLARLLIVIRHVTTAGTAVEGPHVSQMAIYWHYLTALWMAMFALFTLSHGMAPPMQ